MVALLVCRFFNLLADRLVTHTETRAVREHARSNVHGEQFLEEKLGGVGNVNLGDARLVVAGPTFVEAFLELTVFLVVSTCSKEK